MGMSSDRIKRASEWFYSTVFQDETIQPRPQVSNERLPAALQAARSLERTDWQSRNAVFVQQGKLLADYQDDYEFHEQVLRYWPTYQALSDHELRGYFSWRTKLRAGDIQQAPVSFAYLYIYELLNQIGVANPEDGYRKLKEFRDVYGQLDKSILFYLNSWITDYVIYYELDPALLADTRQAAFDRSVGVLSKIQSQDDAQVMKAVTFLAPRWLNRSKFYAQHREDMDTIIPRVLRRMSEHYAKRCKRTMLEQFFGAFDNCPITLFSTAVFYEPKKPQSREYVVSEGRIYRCRYGLWSIETYSVPEYPNSKLDALMKTIDAVARECYGDRHPIKMKVDTKWQLKLIREVIQTFLEEKKAAEARKVTIDYSKLAGIRRDAAVTQDKLIVEEEEPEAPIPEAPVTQPESPIPETSLSQPEYHLLQCLLYGRDLSWVRSSGLMLSVLVDGINEKLYDEFADSVLTSEDPPTLIEDYIQDLKEMIHP